MRRYVPLVTLLVLCLTSPALAQFETATVVGTVRDASGGIVTDAKVSLTTTQTGVNAERVTDPNGSFEFFTVQVGTYVLSAEKPGFSVANTTNKAGGKVHLQVNPRLTAFGRVGWRDVDIFDDPNIPLPSGGAGNAETYVRNKQLALGTTYTATSTSLLEVRFGWSGTEGGKNPAGLGTASALDAYGISGLPSDPRVAGGLPTQLITGFSDLGRQAMNPQWQYPTVYNPKVNYTWLAGRHSLKSGQRLRPNGALADVRFGSR